MPDELPDDPTRERTDQMDQTGGTSDRPLLVRLWETVPVAWKHDELFRYALILSILAWLVILSHAGSGGHYR